MTTSKASNGNSLKSVINGLQLKDYFPWIESEDKYNKPALNYLASLVEQYRQAEFINHYSNAGHENMDEAVYWMLGQGDYVDNILAYRFATQSLLRLLATPSVVEAINKTGRSVYPDTAEMLDNLLDFFIKLDSPVYRTMLFLHNLQQDPIRDEERLAELIEEYEERLKVASAGKFQNSY